MNRKRIWSGNPETAPSYYVRLVRSLEPATATCDELVLVEDQDGEEHVMTRRQFEAAS